MPTFLEREIAQASEADDNVSPDPARTLWVAQSWADNVDATKYFTTLAAALTQAATMTPLQTNPVLIMCYPIPAENLTLISNVTIASAGPGGTVVQVGNCTWSPTDSITEQINLTSVTFTSGSTLTVNSTGKSGGSCTLNSLHCVFQNMAFTGRANNLDTFFAYSANLASSTVTFTDWTGSAQTVGVEFSGCRYRAMTIAGATQVRMQSGDHILGTIALTGTSSLHAAGVVNLGAITVASGCTLRAVGCNLVSTLAVASGGTADIRHSSYTPASVTGPGTINRSIINGTTAATSVGANDITLAIPLPTGSTTYGVKLSLVSGAGNAAATITGKAEDKFVLTDSVGTNVWDYTVTQE